MTITRRVTTKKDTQTERAKLSANHAAHKNTRGYSAQHRGSSVINHRGKFGWKRARICPQRVLWPEAVRPTSSYTIQINNLRKRRASSRWLPPTRPTKREKFPPAIPPERTTALQGSRQELLGFGAEPAGKSTGADARSGPVRWGLNHTVTSQRTQIILHKHAGQLQN